MHISFLETLNHPTDPLTHHPTPPQKRPTQLSETESSHPNERIRFEQTHLSNYCPEK